MNSEEFREDDREGPTKAKLAEKMAENNAWDRNSRRGNLQPRCRGKRSHPGRARVADWKRGERRS